MRCRKCGRTISKFSDYCHYCGANQSGNGYTNRNYTDRCQGCGARLSPYVEVCPRCGLEQDNQSPRKSFIHYVMPILVIFALVYCIVNSGQTFVLPNFNSPVSNFAVDADNNYYINLAKQTVDENPTSYTRLLNAMVESGIPREKAVYGLDSCGVDWAEQAARAVEWYKSQGDYSDEVIKLALVQQELYTVEQAEAGLEIYNEKFGINNKTNIFEIYDTTYIEYIDTNISTLDNGDRVIESRFNAVSTEKCNINFSICYFNDYKEQIDSASAGCNKRIEPGETIITLTTTIPSAFYWNNPEYIVMMQGEYFSRDDIIKINLVK